MCVCLYKIESSGPEKCIKTNYKLAYVFISLPHISLLMIMILCFLSLLCILQLKWLRFTLAIKSLWKVVHYILYSVNSVMKTIAFPHNLTDCHSVINIMIRERITSHIVKTNGIQNEILPIFYPSQRQPKGIPHHEKSEL